MSQKTLLSFFKPKGQISDNHDPKKSVVEEESNCSADESSPIKTTKGKKRLRISSSESENELENAESKNKETNSKNKTCSANKLSKIAPTESDDIAKKCINITGAEAKENSDSSSGKNEIKKSNNCKKEEKTIESPKKKHADGNVENSKETKCLPVESYNPASSNYHPIKDACWGYHQKVPYFALAKTFESIESESARLKMIHILSNFLRSVMVLTPNDLLACVYLSLNRLGPAHEGLELGLAEQTLIRAISQSTGRTVTQIRNDIHEVGDLGSVSEKSRTSQKLMFKPESLTVSGVFKKFTEIANMTGKAAINKKISIISSMYIACKGPEAKFLVRSLNGKLRIGLAEQSVLQAIALACATTPPNQSYPPKKIDVSSTMSDESFKQHSDDLSLILKTTYCQCPHYGLILPVLLKEGIESLPKHCKITPGLPVKPMLAQPTKGVQDVLTRFDGVEFTCEWKYDGERAQIHYLEDGSVNIYSRNQENNTEKYPDIISRIKEVKKNHVQSFILDCEAVAWDVENKQILPFQILSTRKRKDVVEADVKVQVCVFMFDLLYLNGESLVKKVFADRRRLLRENFNEVPSKWSFATSMDTTRMEEVQEFLEESIKGKCEGLMVKTLKQDATYEIAKRSRNWLKLKKDYLEGIGDTLDLVALGGYLGKGKRTGTYGGFLIGCYDKDSEEYQSICKIGTGFSDESLAMHTEFFKSHLVTKAPSYYQYDMTLEPDHWFEPVQVWEIKCADFSLSPIHRAAIGIVDPEKGISLRFPRFLRIRDDKKPEEATTSRQIVDLYESQEQVKSQQKNVKFYEEDFY